MILETEFNFDGLIHSLFLSIWLNRVILVKLLAWHMAEDLKSFPHLASVGHQGVLYCTLLSPTWLKDQHSVCVPAHSFQTI